MNSIQPSGGTHSLAITGAKGGVGKSNLVLNLAVALGRWGRRVLLVDGDLGLANIDVLLGLTPERNIEHLVRGEARLDEILLQGPKGVRILPAASGVPDLTRLDCALRSRLLTMLSEGANDVDQLLVDTGAGLGNTTLTLQLAASRVILVTTPEPTSLVDAYASLKVLWSTDPEKPVDLVVNAARDDEEGERTYNKIANAAEQFLGQRPGWLGAVYSDPNLVDAVRRQRAVLELHPDTPASRCYERIAVNLAHPDPRVGASIAYWDSLNRAGQRELLH